MGGTDHANVHGMSPPRRVETRLGVSFRDELPQFVDPAGVDRLI
jgi:hypothetical protein